MWGCCLPAQAKTGVDGPEQQRMVRDMVREYVKGLCWVMAYYYDGARARHGHVTTCSWPSRGTLPP